MVMKIALDVGVEVVYIQVMTLDEAIQKAEKRAERGAWYPANGGKETPFLTRSGRRLVYCWQPSTGKHAYLDLGTDLFLDDEEARLALGM